MRNSMISRFLVAAAALVVVAMFSNPVAAQCDPNPCPDKQICKFGQCRMICCSDAECTVDGEVCYRKVCMPQTEVDVLKSKAAAAGQKKAEQDKADADAARQKAEQDKADADAARQKAEQDKADADAARLKAEQDKADADAARLKAEQGKADALAAEKEANTPRSFEIGGSAWLLFAGVPDGRDEASLPFGGRIKGAYNFWPSGHATILLGGGGEMFSLPEKESYAQDIFLELAGRFFPGQPLFFLQPSVRGGIAWSHYKEDGTGPFIETTLGLGLRPHARFLFSLEGGWRRDTVQFGGADTGVCLLTFMGGL